MSDLFRALQAEKLASKLPPPLKVYLVVAYHKELGWSVRRQAAKEEHQTIEAAREHAESLADCWSNIRIYELSYTQEDR